MLLGGDGARGESQCRRMTSIENTNLVTQYLHNVPSLLCLEHWKIHEDINRFQVCVCCLKDHFNMEFFRCSWIQSAVHAAFTSSLMFSMHAFYCLILSAGFLLQFDRNSLPSTIVLHSNGQIRRTAALQTMKGVNRHCLKANISRSRRTADDPSAYDSFTNRPSSGLQCYVICVNGSFCSLQ